MMMEETHQIILEDQDLKEYKKMMKNFEKAVEDQLKAESILKSAKNFIFGVLIGILIGLIFS